MNNYTINVGTTATVIWKSTNPAGDNIILCTTGTGKDVHFGGSDVTTSAFGFHMANNVGAYSITVPYGKTLYGVVSTAAANVQLCWTNPNV